MAQRKRPARKVEVASLVGDKPKAAEQTASVFSFTLTEAEVEGLLSGKSKVSRECADGLPKEGDSIEAFGHAFTVLSVVQKGSKWNVKFKS